MGPYPEMERGKQGFQTRGPYEAPMVLISDKRQRITTEEAAR